MSGDLPWGLVKPLGTKVEFDPTALDGVTPWFAYSVEENDLHLEIYFHDRNHVHDEERPRRFVAEQPDAVHIALVFEVVPPRPGDYKIGRSLPGYEPWVEAAPVMLEVPLGERPVLDATRGVVTRRVRSRPPVEFVYALSGQRLPPELTQTDEPEPRRWWQRGPSAPRRR